MYAGSSIPARDRRRKKFPFPIRTRFLPVPPPPTPPPPGRVETGVETGGVTLLRRAIYTFIRATRRNILMSES